MSTLFSVLQMVWRFFTEVECPFLGISFASLFIGVLLVNFSITLLRPLLGIGGSAVKGTDRMISHRLSSARSKRRNKEE